MINNTIKTISTTDFRNNMKTVLDSTRKTLRPTIISDRNIPRVALIDIDEYEDFLSFQNPEFIKSIKKSRNEKVSEMFSLKEAFA
jgi:prevent-host-death family protein